MGIHIVCMMQKKRMVAFQRIYEFLKKPKKKNLKISFFSKPPHKARLDGEGLWENAGGEKDELS